MSDNTSAVAHATLIHDECPGCVEAFTKARAQRGDIIACRVCNEPWAFPQLGGMQHRVMGDPMPPQRWGPDPKPQIEPLPPVRRLSWVWQPDPAKDIAAITWVPGANEAGSDLALESEDDQAEREHRRAARAYHGRQRLRDMRVSKHAEGERFAAVLEYVHGARSPALNKRESCAIATSKRFASKAERATLKSDMDHIQFGVRLTGAAETAYVEGYWLAVTPTAEPGPREAKWQEAAERLATALKPKDSTRT